jgi:histidinol dehydrogenase
MRVWDLEREFEGLLAFVIGGRERKRQNIRAAVEDIRKGLIAGGDDALVEFSRRWDGWTKPYPLKVADAEIDQALSRVGRKDLGVLKGMIRNVTAYHRGQRPRGRTYRAPGIVVKDSFVPVEKAMVYVPGGTAPYPSSLVMGAVPARLAGVPYVCVSTPAHNGEVHPFILAAARVLGIGDVFRVGGAQAIYAFARGTGTIPKVDMIVGPGNAFVEEAKRDVYGTVGIDMLAGPTELIILSTEAFNPSALAWDLFSQAEHDEMATVGLFSPSAEHLQEVKWAVERLLPAADRRGVIEKALSANGFLVRYGNVEKAIEAINRIAPEHMELLGDEKEANRIRYPGIVYLGPHTNVALGDYYIGTNHVLPTGGAGRFAGGLSVDCFMRRKVVVKTGASFLEAYGEKAMRLAAIEGLSAHARAIEARKELQV